MSTKSQESLRVHVTLPSIMVAKIDVVKDMTGLVENTEVVRYLVARGLEAMNAQISSQRLMSRMEHQYSPQEMLPLMEALQNQGTQTIE